MKTVFVTLAAALLAIAFAGSADAARMKKDPAMAAKEAGCKAEAKNMFPGLHPKKRRAHVKECMAKM